MMRNQSRHAHDLHATYYVNFSKDHSGEYARLEQEYLQILAALRWLSSHLSEDTAQSLVDALGSLKGYFLQRARYGELLKLLPFAVEACGILKESPVQIYQLGFQSQYAVGNWQLAQVEIEKAVAISAADDLPLHAESLRLLGTFQLNRGNYRTALRTLKMAEETFRQIGAMGKIGEIRAEQAAFYLNRGQYRMALDLYLESDELYRQARQTDESSDHMLLMLGVVYRRLRQFPQAEEKLLALIDRGRKENSASSLATGSHHLAWVRIDQTKFEQAGALAREALGIYQRIDDLRGQADAYEQLGEIGIQSGRLPDAQQDLIRSLQIRQQLGNRHGTASSLKRLGRAYLYAGQYGLGARYTIKSLALYGRLNMLSGSQLRHILFGVLDAVRKIDAPARIEV